MTRMNRIINLRPKWLFLLYLVADAICVGMGMGVPFFCILFGFGAGWVVSQRVTQRESDLPLVLRRILWLDVICAGITLVGMAILWLPFTSYLFDPSKDLANSGIPMILYTPLASFVGWMVLIVLISPFLQLLTSLFGSYVALLNWSSKTKRFESAV